MAIFIGGLSVATYIIPDLPETTEIKTVNVEEFQEIYEELDLTLKYGDLIIKNDGENVRVKDSGYGKAYRVTEDEGDITAEDYLKERKEHNNNINKKVKQFGVIMTVTGAVSLASVYVVDKKVCKNKKRT